MQRSYDFTQGKIPKLLLLFSGPIYLTNLLQSSYQLIDSLWVGNLLGALALGAVALSSTVVFTVLSFIIGMNGASLTILSQQKGAGDEEGLKQSLNAFVVVLGLMSLLFGMLGFYLSGPILHWLGTPDNVLSLARVYLQVNFLGIPFLFGYNFVNTVLRAVGNSRAPVRFVSLAVILNAVLDPVLIVFFNMGIAGAALATVVAQGTAFVYGLFYSIRVAKLPFTIPQLPKKREIQAIFKLGVPGGLQMMAISGGSLAIMGIVAIFGANVLAGFGATQRIGQLIMIASFTIGSAVTSMAGQNIGAKKWGRVGEVARSGLIFILVISFATSAVVFLFAEPLISLFVDDQETIEYGTRYLRAIAFFYPFLGINFVLNGVVRAAGAMFQVLVLNLISFWILRVPFSYLFSQWFGALGIAYGIGVSFVLSSAVASFYYRYGRWREIEIFSSKEK